LTEAAPIERFGSLRRDLAALYAGYYIAELLSDLTDFHDPHPKLFDAATITLRHLGDPSLRGRRLLRFELACLRELGLMPALDACAHCGAAVAARGESVSFGLATGGVICPACRPGQPHVATLSGSTLAAIRDLAAPGRAWRGLELGPSGSASIRATLGAVISHAIGRRPRLLPYLGA
jgi:DNA repair protein RecO (recombination protein O)